MIMIIFLKNFFCKLYAFKEESKFEFIFLKRSPELKVKYKK